MSAQTWFVETPTYSVHEVVLEDGSGPDYDISDWVEVEADTRREAVSKAVKDWLAETHYWREQNYCQRQRGDDMSPFTGVKAVSEQEAKAQTKAAGPPDFPPDMCDACDPPHDLGTDIPLTWIWVDEHYDTDLRWGWFGTCGAIT